MNDHQPITDISYVSRINKSKILRLIRSREHISRAEIGKEMGLSLPTVSRLVDSLIHNEKLVIEEGTAAPSRGRPPQLVRFAGESNYVIGINISPKTITGILSNLNAESLAEKRITSESHQGLDVVVARTAELIQQLIDSSGVDQDKVMGIGIGIGGLIDPANNRVIYSANFDWTNVDLANELQRYISLPIKVDNDARVMGLGELWFGIGSHCKNFICIYIGHGIGSSIIIDGQPFYGSKGMAGEFGYITLEKDSDWVDSGMRGTVQALASGNSISLIAKQRMGSRMDSQLHHLCSGDPESVTTTMVAQAAKEGDELARTLLLETAEYLGIGVANLIMVLNPAAVVIGGGVSNSGDLFFDRIREVVRERTLRWFSESVQILPASHGSRTKVMGAIALIMNEILNLQIVKEDASITVAAGE